MVEYVLECTKIQKDIQVSDAAVTECVGNLRAQSNRLPVIALHWSHENVRQCGTRNCLPATDHRNGPADHAGITCRDNASGIACAKQGLIKRFLSRAQLR